MKTRYLALLLPVLAGCSWLATPAVDQYRLDFTLPTAPDGANPLPYQLVVDTPVAMQALDTENIATYGKGDDQRYYTGVRWTDRAPVLLQDALIRSLAAGGQLQGASRREAGVRADYILQTDLQNFEAEPDGSGKQAHIAFTANLVAMSDHRIVASRFFEAKVPADGTHFEGVVNAFDQATAQAMQDVVGWVNETLAVAKPNSSIQPER